MPRPPSADWTIPTRFCTARSIRSGSSIASHPAKLSIALGSKTTAEKAFRHHTQALKLASGGTWAVTVGEVAAVELSSFEQPLENSPAHGFIDFRHLSRRAMESKAKLLVAKARDRGCAYQSSR